MARIYGDAAPSITSVREPAEEEFLQAVTSIVREAVINARGFRRGKQAMYARRVTGGRRGEQR